MAVVRLEKRSAEAETPTEDSKLERVLPVSLPPLPSHFLYVPQPHLH